MERKEVNSIALSNTYDINPENKRNLPSNIVFSPFIMYHKELIVNCSMVLLKRVFLTFLLVIFLNISFSYAQAQYKNGIGVRLSSLTSLDYKHFFDNKSAIEIMAGSHYRWFGVGVSALYERHGYFDKRRMPGIDWYYGGGITMGYWDNFNDQGWHPDYEGAYFGLAAIVGVEFTPPEAPMVNIFIDFKPSMRFFGPNHWGEASFGFKYVWN